MIHRPWAAPDADYVPALSWRVRPPGPASERIEPEELADQGWVVGPSSGDAPEFGAWPGIAEPRITFTARDWPTRLGLVAAGLGIALVPGIAAQAVPRAVR